MRKIKLSIIILSWNSKKLLEQCLESLFKSLKVSKFQSEIVVVDNGSIDGSVEMVRGYGVRSKESGVGSQESGVGRRGLTTEKESLFTPHSSLLSLSLIENQKNLGFAKGNNLGLGKAMGDLVMILNPDTVVQPNALDKLISFLSFNQDGLVAVSPLLLLPEGIPQAEYYMRFPNLWQIFLYHNPVLRPFSMAIPFLKSKIAQSPQGKPFEVDQLPGAAMIAPKKVWLKVGQFDEDYNFLFEDVDWCWRARKLGIKLMVVPGAKITHLGGASWKEKLKQNSADFYYQFFASMLFFVRKNYKEFEGKIFKWAIVFNLFLTFKPKLSWRFLKNNGQQGRFL